MQILDVMSSYFEQSGFGQFQWPNLIMIGIGILFITLAIRKGFEPLLLVPIGFGIIIGNIPYNSSALPLSVYDGPAPRQYLHVYEVELDQIQLAKESTPIDFQAYLESWKPKALQDRQRNLADRLAIDEVFVAQTQAPNRSALRQAAADEAQRRLSLADVHFDAAAMTELLNASAWVTFHHAHEVHDWVEGYRLLDKGQAVLINSHSLLTVSTRSLPVEDFAPGVYQRGQGRQVFIEHATTEGKYPQIWNLDRQEPSNASVFWWLFAGVGLAGFYPPLIFLGIGALTDFGPMLSNPKTLLLGAAAQFGIFGALFGAVYIFGFSMAEAASIGIIGGADGPTAIFTASQLAPHLLGAVALAAYSYMAMVPIIQPPIIKLLTTREERLIRMQQGKPVSKTVRMVFPVAGFILTAFLAPGALPLLGMFFFGNLLRESMVTDRLAKTAQTSFIDIVTILLGVTVGAKTSADYFLTEQTIFIFVLGMVAFVIATATGVLFGKLLNYVTKEPINPMIGAAGVSAVPMAARVVHRMGQDEDPQNFLLMHAMGPNVAGVVGSAVSAGVLLSWLASS